MHYNKIVIIAAIVLFVPGRYLFSQDSVMQKRLHLDKYTFSYARLYYHPDLSMIVTYAPSTSGVLFDERFKEIYSISSWANVRYLSLYVMNIDSSYTRKWSTQTYDFSFGDNVHIFRDGQFVLTFSHPDEYDEERKWQRTNTIVLYDSMGTMIRKYSTKDIFNYHPHMFRDTTFVNFLYDNKIDEDSLVLFFPAQLRIDKVFGHYMSIDTFSLNLLTGKLTHILHGR